MQEAGQQERLLPPPGVLPPALQAGVPPSPAWDQAGDGSGLSLGG